MLDKYKYTEKEVNMLLKSMRIVIDKREQCNMHIVEGLKSLKVEILNKSLKYGDYAFMLPENKDLGIMKDVFFCNDIVIERKNSLEELSGNIAQNRTQFENEFLRANKCKKILVISGIGVREYYKNLGYNLENTYMIKKLN